MSDIKNLDSIETEEKRIDYLKGMALHESCYFLKNSNIDKPSIKPSYIKDKYTILKVVGGWIYTNTVDKKGTFVPYSTEDDMKESSGNPYIKM